MLNPALEKAMAENEREMVYLGVAERPHLQPIGYTFGELQKLELPRREEIIRGLARCESGLLNSVTNVGKTTLLRNLALSLITGRQFGPLTDGTQKRRVAIIDSEDTLSFLRSDINKMIAEFTDQEKKLVDENLLLICDVSIAGEELRLNKPEHFNILTDRLLKFESDIVFIDTISKCFVIQNENDNSEVKEQVMKPLKRLAKRTNSAVLSAHHIGKAKLEEGTAREGSHRGRGASSFADLSRMILNLERDSVNSSVILSCPKLKGVAFPEQVLRLNTDTRWFEVVGETKTQTSYELVVGMFADGVTYTTKETVGEFKGVIAERTVKRMLNEAVRHCDLQKVKQGHYRKNDPVLIEVQDSAIVPDE